jgi:hypothetical protein
MEVNLDFARPNSFASFDDSGVVVSVRVSREDTFAVPFLTFFFTLVVIRVICLSVCCKIVGTGEHYFSKFSLSLSGVIINIVNPWYIFISGEVPALKIIVFAINVQALVITPLIKSTLGS